MPSDQFTLLTDREREYLENPDSFAPQRAAEVRYRIRQKYEAIANDIDLLHETALEWDTTTTTTAGVVHCRGCDEWTPLTKIESDRTNDSTRRVGEGWVYRLSSMPPGNKAADYEGTEFDESWVAKHFGWCEECQPDAKTKQAALNSGRVPCYAKQASPAMHADHPDSHRVGSEPFKECTRAGYIPLSKEELARAEANHS